MTQASWPGPARPPPRTPEHAAPAQGLWLAVARELLGLLATLAVLVGLLVLISRMGSVP